MTTDPKVLLKQLALLRRVIPSKGQPLWQLECVCFNEGGIHSTDLNTYITIKQEHDIRLCVDAKRLYNAILGVQNQPSVTLTHIKRGDGGRLKIVAGATEISLGGFNDKEFPIPFEINGNWEPFAQGIDSNLIYSSVFFAGKDEIRPSMSGVNINAKHVVATDAHLMVMRPVDCAVAEEKSAIIPPIVCKMLNKCGDIDIQGVPMSPADNERVASYANYSHGRTSLPGGVEVIWRNIDARYPNYEAVWPKTRVLEVSLNRKELLATVITAGKLANSTTRQVGIEILNGLTAIVSASNVDYDDLFSSTVQLTCHVPNEPPFKIGFNAYLLTKCLKHLKGENVTIGFNAPNQAAYWMTKS